MEPGQSGISTSTTVLDADGVASCTVYVTAKNTDQTDGQPNSMAGLAASNVVLAVTPSTGVTITQPTGLADTSGLVTGSFVSTNAATVEVSATVLGAAVTSGNATVVVGGGAPVDPPSGDPFYEQPTTVGNTRLADNGFTWNSTGARVTEVEVPAGKTGYGLRFRYGPDADAQDSGPEQRFALGRSCSHLWIEYDVYLGANFVHRRPANLEVNNKFMAFWRDSYGASAQTWMCGWEYTTTAGTTPDSIVAVNSNREDFAFWTTATVGGWIVTGQSSTFISPSGPITPGEWAQIRIELAAASESGASDGIQRMWIDGVLYTSITNAKYWNPDSVEPDTVLKNGYFWGWANSGFLDETLVYVYGAKFYDTDPGWL
jgi:hypothetical protein